jgi:predicted  nucleic acid-binding Zn-ribbon protein
MEEKKDLMGKVQYLEHENEKLTKKFSESSSKIDSYESKLIDAEKRVKSSEMKLRTFLGIHTFTHLIFSK